MTVNWEIWMQLSPAGQAAMVREYKRIVRVESERARETNYRAMTEAMAAVGRGDQ